MTDGATMRPSASNSPLHVGLSSNRAPSPLSDPEYCRPNSKRTAVTAAKSTSDRSLTATVHVPYGDSCTKPLVSTSDKGLQWP